MILLLHTIVYVHENIAYNYRACDAKENGIKVQEFKTRHYPIRKKKIFVFTKQQRLLLGKKAKADKVMGSSLMKLKLMLKDYHSDIQT